MKSVVYSGSWAGKRRFVFFLKSLVLLRCNQGGVLLPVGCRETTFERNSGGTCRAAQVPKKKSLESRVLTKNGRVAVGSNCLAVLKFLLSGLRFGFLDPAELAKCIATHGEPLIFPLPNSACCWEATQDFYLIYLKHFSPALYSWTQGMMVFQTQCSQFLGRGGGCHKKLQMRRRKLTIPPVVEVPSACVVESLIPSLRRMRPFLKYKHQEALLH